ncbi:ubiquitin carboxyl-terminal hydrolase MINDY-1 isoform X2 [Mangifera indica]|uniref:ubiquitin carboxyl-terminal hydrolase MINDY-1 isoform X2 n=1 Tax=Mangifera indica TaxID=29780 RepID=UPI001CFA6E41|nr:ubiquitin carboxyl-terminal hydrolase MINDY-1 isoform X2 [Mangifera indica]
MAESSEEPQQQQTVVKECMHKTKTIQFFGRTTPIILQNDNGPCPLLAICNVLLLKNDLKLSPDTGEVSQEKLLALVANRLLESNSNVNTKDAGYVENQQQNISDAIDLLPRLATGIDVNIKFRRIDDFEFTRECAIFDLLDIPLYHGWIVDPQDYDTTNAIGSKSYNSLMGELVALETMVGESKNNFEEDCIDFAAATTATLGVPSPCLSKTKSFDDSPRSALDQPTVRKGDLEEQEELWRVLKLSETEKPSSLGDSHAPIVSGVTMSVNSGESTSDIVHTLEGHIGVKNQSLHQPEASISDNITALSNDGNNNLSSSGSILGGEVFSAFKNDGGVKLEQSSEIKSVDHILCNDLVEKSIVETLFYVEEADLHSGGKDAASMGQTHGDVSHRNAKVDSLSAPTTDVHEPADNLSGCSMAEVSCQSVPNADSDSSSGRIQHVDFPETFTSSVADSEPIYEGEECILDSGTASYGNREPVYEGEVILAEEADKSALDAGRSKDVITPQQGELIKNFLKNSASQLTIYGLFCLQDGLKERELCVFFRNNHFSTMFKYDRELYLLATDQGYINQPDLVWEKLNEVNGDTLFMTSNFKEFKVESQANDPWDEHGAVASTTDYLASIDTAAQAGLDMNSDLQLAIALQQQEFEQQPQRSNSRPQPTSGSSRLITGPQVPRTGGRNSLPSSSRAEAKSKDRCCIM